MEFKRLSITAGIGMILGAILSWHLFPQTITVTKVETKTVVVEKETKKTDTVKVVKRVKLPDGTKTTEVTVVDKSVIQSENSVNTATTASSVSAPASKSYFLTLGRSLDKDVYNFGLNRRLLGPIYGGLNVNTDKELTFNLGLEF